MSETKTLAEAIVLLQTRLPRVGKGETANTGTYSYSYAGLDSITEKLMPILGEVGLAFVAKPTLNSDGKFVLAYKLIHVCGDKDEGEYPLPSGTPQQVGSAITYARRYCLLAVTGLAPTGDDDDGKAAEDGHAAAREAEQAERERQRQIRMQASANEARDKALIEPDPDELRKQYAAAAKTGLLNVVVANENGDEEPLWALIKRLGEEKKQAVLA